MKRSFSDCVKLWRSGAVLLAGALLSSCDNSSPSPTLSKRPPPEEPAVASPYKSEQEWIISSICRQIFEQISFAKDKKGEVVQPAQVTMTKAGGDVLSYDVTIRGAGATAAAVLRWPGSIWSPESYLPFAQAAAQALGVKSPGTTTTQGNPLHTLLSYAETDVRAESERISQWMSNEPDNAVAHEQAALVLGTLAMKENSGLFWNPKEACNRATAHLAVAKYFRGNAPLSVEGRLAESLVGLIVDTKAETGRQLDQLEAEPNPPATWPHG